jgi:midasin (ATPase involved in ribosome maturation)
MKHVLKKAINKNTKNNKPTKSWSELNEKLSRFEVQFKHCQTAMAFAFVEGSLIQAVKEGNAMIVTFKFVAIYIYFIHF